MGKDNKKGKGDSWVEWVAAEEDYGDEDGGAEGKPAGVGADVACLHAAGEPAETLGPGGETGAGALDERAFDKAANADAGEAEQDHDEQAVGLVDPVFAGEQ